MIGRRSFRSTFRLDPTVMKGAQAFPPGSLGLSSLKRKGPSNLPYMTSEIGHVKGGLDLSYYQKCLEIHGRLAAPNADILRPFFNQINDQDGFDFNIPRLGLRIVIDVGPWWPQEFPGTIYKPYTRYTVLILENITAFAVLKHYPLHICKISFRFLTSYLHQQPASIVQNLHSCGFKSFVSSWYLKSYSKRGRQRWNCNVS
jgi:hypothetical protein